LEKQKKLAVTKLGRRRRHSNHNRSIHNGFDPFVEAVSRKQWSDQLTLSLRSAKPDKQF
jgi:hypothetical protein